MQPLEEFQLTVARLSSRLIELEHTRTEFTGDGTYLKARYERQQQNLIALQMKMEQRSLVLEEELQRRESARLHVQHICKVSSTLRAHCQSVHQTLGQLNRLHDILKHSSEESIQRFEKLEHGAMDLMEGPFLEIRKLQESFKEEVLAGQVLEETFCLNQQHIKTAHDDELKSLNMKVSAIESIVQNQELDLKSVETCIRDKKEEKLKISQQLEEKINSLVSEVSNIKTDYEDLNTKQERKFKEKISLDSDLNAIKCEVNVTSERIASVDAELIGFKETVEELNQNITAVKETLKNKLEILEKLKCENLEAQLEFTDLSVKLGQSEKDGQLTISELLKRVEKTKLSGQTNIDELNQDLTTAALEKDESTLMFENLKNSVLAAKSKLMEIKDFINQAISKKSLLEKNLNTQTSEQSRLQSVRKERVDCLNQQKEEISHLSGLTQEQQKLIEQETETLSKKLEDTKEKIEITKQCFLAKEKAVALLNQQLEEIRKESLHHKAVTENQYTSILSDLRKKVLLLTETKEKKKIQYEKNLESGNEDLLYEKNLLALKAEAISEASKISDKCLEEISLRRCTFEDLSLQKNKVVELDEDTILTLSTLERHVREADQHSNDLQAIYKETISNSEGKEERINYLRKAIDQLETEKTEYISKNSADVKSLLQDIVDSKQTWESFSINVNQLKYELEDLKKTFALKKQELEEIQKYMSVLTGNYKSHITEIKQKNIELDKMRKDFQIQDQKVKKAKIDTRLLKKEYKEIVDKIVEAKAKKRALLETVPEKENLPEAQKEDPLSKVVTPQAQCGVLEETTEITPRSILKRSKQPTPQSAKKSVTFALPSSGEDNGASSSSTIVQ